MAAGDVARHRAEMPSETAAILDRRSLARDHRRLAAMLRPGQRVLDVGCGTGAITRGIVEAVGPGGRVLGVDANRELIDAARRAHGAVAGRHAQPPLSRGSSRSRSASPSMLKPKTASDSAAAGQIASHGARYMWSRPVSESMPPHVG